MVAPDRMFEVADSGKAISYGPGYEEDGPWCLWATTTDGERVCLQLDETAMYELWTEVHNTPWPRDGRGIEGRLRRSVVALAESADELTLRDALEVLGGEER
jgi:hypothetical protein